MILSKIMCNIGTKYVRNYYLEYIIGGVQDKIRSWNISQHILWKEALHGNITNVKILYNFPELMMQVNGKTYQVWKEQRAGAVSIQVLLHPLLHKTLSCNYVAKDLLWNHGINVRFLRMQYVAYINNWYMLYARLLISLSLEDENLIAYESNAHKSLV